MRLIDGDALLEELPVHPKGGMRSVKEELLMIKVRQTVQNAPTIGGWISVKNDLPKEHDSIFAYMPLVKGMWAKESDNVIVYVRFPDGTGRATEGRLHDGEWWTRISSALDPVVTHWQPFPGSPKEE